MPGGISTWKIGVRGLTGRRGALGVKRWCGRRYVAFRRLRNASVNMDPRPWFTGHLDLLNVEIPPLRKATGAHEDSYVTNSLFVLFHSVRIARQSFVAEKRRSSVKNTKTRESNQARLSGIFASLPTISRTRREHHFMFHTV